MAGFEVIIYGRFWVIAEDLETVVLTISLFRRQLMAATNDSITV
jgi:hypothetical protein